jgi:hypothetical protein
MFIESSHLHEQLQLLEPITPLLLNPNATEKVVDKHLQELLHSFNALVGHSYGHATSFQPNREWGILHQLHHYLVLFINKIGAEFITPLIAIQNELRETLLLTLQCRDFLRFLKEPHMRATTTQYVSFIRSYSQVTANVTKLIQAIHELIPHFKDDENLLFFLLRHQQNLNRLYGKEFLSTLLLSLFPDGLQEMEEFLHTKYSARSFHHILPQISEHFAALRET